MLPSTWRRVLAASVLIFGGLAQACADLPDTIARIKPSITLVGTFKKTNSPPFTFRGTGFVVGDGRLVATNAHVLPDLLEADGTILAIQARREDGQLQLRQASKVAVDKDHDLALLRIDGPPLPALALGQSRAIREGQPIAFTGFPIGGSLGFSPVTHRGIVSAITPIALPSPTARQLSGTLINRLKNGAFDIFQLDATAYPGNSGSPVYDEETAAVIGIINMVYVKGSKEAALSQPSGISYAIPVDYLVRLLAQRP